jgi:hypothetical protein
MVVASVFKRTWNFVVKVASNPLAALVLILVLSSFMSTGVAAMDTGE